MFPELKVISSIHVKGGWVIEGYMGDTYFKAEVEDFRDELICKKINAVDFQFDIGRALVWYGLVDKVELG